MDTKKKVRKGSRWLWLLVLVSIAVVGGWKWTEHLSSKENERAQFLARFQKEKSDLVLKLSLAERATRVSGSEAERLREENTLLQAKLADCGKKPKPTAKRVVPRAKNVRVAKPKKTEEPKAFVSPKSPQAQEETLAQKLEKACGGRPAKFVGGKWICAKTEPSAPVTPRDDFFANAIDEEVEVQATPVQVPQRVVYAAPVYEPLSRPNCMSQPFWDSDERFYPAGFQHDRRSNGKCRCGSPGCDFRWPQSR